MRLLLRARVGRLRFVRAGRLLFHGSPLALTLGCAHTLLCGRFVFARVVEEQACVGVFAQVGWLGWVFALLPVFAWVFALACVRSPGGGGTVWSRPPLAPLAWLRAHALVWACWRVRGLCAVGWAEGG